MPTYNPNLAVPEEISRKALELKTWMEMFGAESIYGMGDVFKERNTSAEVIARLQRQLAERNQEIAELIHPHDLAKYRNGK